MGKAVELISYQATAPSVGAPFLAVAGNSLTIRDSRSPVWLGPVWQSRQVAGFQRVTSPLLHDAVQGIQMHAPIGQSVSLWQSAQRLYPQDSLIVAGTGSAVAGDIEQGSMLVMYEDLPGVDGYFITESELDSRGEDVYTSTNTLASGLVGGYSGAETINSEVDQLKANTDYAIIGYSMGLAVAANAVRYVASDWGNLGVGGPGIVSPSNVNQTRDWFVQVGRLAKMASIPVFNSSNKALVFVDTMVDENGADPVVSTIMIRLSPKGRGKRQ